MSILLGHAQAARIMAQALRGEAREKMSNAPKGFVTMMLHQASAFDSAATMMEDKMRDDALAANGTTADAQG